MSVLVLSLFDGMSCGQVALSKFTKDYSYFASEVDEKPIMVTQHNFPDTLQMGSVTEINSKDFGSERPFLLLGGSPCGDFSIIGRRKGMITKCNMKITSFEQYQQLKNEGYEFFGQSFLFWEFVRILRETKPKYFLLENVNLKGKTLEEYGDIINEALGVKPILINSNTVSAQNRERLYWTNIPGVTVPEDKGITIHDIIPGSVGSVGKRGVWDKSLQKYVQSQTVRTDSKSNCLTKSVTCNKVQMCDNTVRPYTIEEREMFQTLPVGYTDVPGVTYTDRLMMTGNGWTIDVITHIFSFIPEFRSKVTVEVTSNVLHEFETTVS